MEAERISGKRLFPEVEATIASLKDAGISQERRQLLNPLKSYLQQQVDAGDAIRLVFVCTHNSRRSHLAQVWAQVFASYYGIPNLYSYSAGTKATALYPVVGETLEQQGLEIMNLSEGPNPIYAIKYGPQELPVICFSKSLGHGFNPTSGFAAIMTCGQADQECPVVIGADMRFSLPFEDPKDYDGTPQQKAQYQERSRQIAGEMNYVFSKINL